MCTYSIHDIIISINPTRVYEIHLFALLVCAALRFLSSAARDVYHRNRLIQSVQFSMFPIDPIHQHNIFTSPNLPTSCIVSKILSKKNFRTIKKKSSRSRHYELNIHILKSRHCQILKKIQSGVYYQNLINSFTIIGILSFYNFCIFGF